MNEDESFSGGVGNPSAEKTEDLFACRRGMNIRGGKAFSPRHTSTLAEAALPKLLASFVKALGLRIQDDDIEKELADFALNSSKKTLFGKIGDLEKDS